MYAILLNKLGFLNFLDSTIADSDRTPVGTPVDSLIHQYVLSLLYIYDAINLSLKESFCI